MPAGCGCLGAVTLPDNTEVPGALGLQAPEILRSGEAPGCPGPTGGGGSERVPPLPLLAVSPTLSEG